jgi:hypothetical protein
MNEQQAAHFIVLGQLAAREVAKTPDLAPSESLFISHSYDLAALMPEATRDALSASEAYKVLFVFEHYLRDLVVGTISKDGVDWWSLVPTDVQDEVVKLEETEEAKTWMALGSRDRSALLTYPQLLRIIDHCWKTHFEDLVRDKTLIQEARLISHLRNTICHMTPISGEELERIKQTMRDWFRMVAP